MISETPFDQDDPLPPERGKVRHPFVYAILGAWPRRERRRTTDEGDVEEVVINPCPACQTEGGHTYMVTARRTEIFGTFGGSVPSVLGIRFCRVVFRCPTTGQSFAATLRLRLLPYEDISSVGEPRPVPDGELNE